MEHPQNKEHSTQTGPDHCLNKFNINDIATARPAHSLVTPHSLNQDTFQDTLSTITFISFITNRGEIALVAFHLTDNCLYCIA